VLGGCTTSSSKKSAGSSEPVYTGHGKKPLFEKVIKPANVSLIKGNDAATIHLMPLRTLKMK